MSIKWVTPEKGWPKKEAQIDTGYENTFIGTTDVTLKTTKINQKNSQ